jgi:threonine dehydratase
LLELKDIEAARARIQNFVRRTPLIEATPVKNRFWGEASLYLKLECLQITGSFKARGAVSKLRSLAPDQLANGLVTASGGNHGLGVAYAGWLAHVPATIYLSHNTPPIKAQKLESWQAKVIFEGEVWDEANRAALAAAQSQGLCYFHPFADPLVIAGQGTLALEILEEIADIDLLLVAIGGGGLISGISLAAKAINPTIKIIGIEPTGAPTLYQSLQAGYPVELAEIKTVANTLAPRQSAQINYDIIRQNVDEIVLVTDEEMLAASRWLWQEMNVATELSGAAALGALMAGKINTENAKKICVLVCGAGSDGITI